MPVNQVKFELQIVRNYYRYLGDDLRALTSYRDLVDRYDRASAELDPVLLRLYDVMYHKGASQYEVCDIFNCGRRTVVRYHSDLVNALAKALAA